VAAEHPNLVVARITGARKGILYDAVIDEHAGQTLLDTIAREGTLPLRRGSLTAWHTPEFAALHGKEPLSASYATAEQSNSMIAFGKRFLMKLFRKFEEGPNPDVEITGYLCERTAFRRVPQLAGAVDYQIKGQRAGAAAMLQARIPSQADGWQHAVQELGRYYERVSVAGTPSAAAIEPAWFGFVELSRCIIPRDVLDLVGGYLESSSQLGRRTAEMHVALASGDSEFHPAPLEAGYIERLATSMAETADHALDSAETRVNDLPADVAPLGRELVSRRGTVRQRFDTLRTLGATDGARIRVHGDYHLAQVLWSENDFYIIDFEGEPARRLADRREKQIPLKDVAGMLRSFGYAAYAGLYAWANTRPDDFTRLEPWARVWQTWTSATFLRTYLEVAATARILPASPQTLDRLLDAFVLDKAMYELRYELNNRPDWVRIPLWGALQITGRGA
jgi:maltose alpha-D-glucosyltransferase/alpha-amylase